MPLVRISLREGKTEAYRRALADGVHRAMVEAIDISVQDRFQIVTEHSVGELIYDPSFFAVERSDDIVIVQITMSAGASPGRSVNSFNECVRYWWKIRVCGRRISWSIWWKWFGKTGRLATEKLNTPSDACGKGA